MESSFRHWDRDVQMLRAEAELGVFRELQVSLVSGGHKSGLEWQPGELGLRVVGAMGGLE